MDNNKKSPDPIISDFTPHNPFLPPVGNKTNPSYMAIFVTFFVVIVLIAAFFAVVHFWESLR